MNRSSRSAAAGSTPYWVEGGSEICSFCHQRYVYELEIRCADCDGPSCPHCTVVERLTTVVHRCPECVDAAEGGE